MIYTTLALFAVWLVLSQSFSPIYLGLGLIASFGVAWVNSRGPSSGTAMSWWRMLIYFPWLFWKILQSGIHVAYLILHPRLPIDPKLIRYHTKLQKAASVVILGNSITLTPGTITAEVNSSELVVHAMDDAAADDLTSLRLERKIDSVFGGMFGAKS